jgi:hypothetical protein
MKQYACDHGDCGPRRNSRLPLILPSSVFIKCSIRRALADGSDPGIDSTVCDETGDTLRLLKISAGICTGDPSDEIEGAEGGDVAAGTEAR